MLAHEPLSVCGFGPSGRNRIRGTENKEFVFQEIVSVRCGGPDCTVSDNNAVHPCDKNGVKVKVTLEQTTKSQRGNRGITTLSLTSALDGGGGW